MSEINALQIWEQLAAECSEALDYYFRCKYPHDDRDELRKRVLNRGAADFDRKHDSGDGNEKEHYRTDFYVSREGYMGRHLEDNLAAFRDYFADDVPQPLLFVDFGCGPMTSGLALAEILSQQTSGDLTQTAYFGVDASRNMSEKANSVNAKYSLFMPRCFKAVQDIRFDSRKIPSFFPKVQTVILCLSFVLAPETLRQPDAPAGDTAKRLADDWKRYIASETQCQETIVIYINPVHDDFEYAASGLKQVDVESVGRVARKVALGVIRGTRK